MGVTPRSELPFGLEQRRSVNDRAIDATVKIAPIAMFSARVVESPNSGNTRICVTTAMP